MPTLGTSHKPHWKASRAGATPKEVTSANESNASPNWVTVPVRRAIRPSSASAKIAIRIKIEARSNWPRLDATTDRKPQKMFATVKSEGMT